jgi:hypothetical protein
VTDEYRVPAWRLHQLQDAERMLQHARTGLEQLDGYIDYFVKGAAGTAYQLTAEGAKAKVTELREEIAA